MIVYFSGTGNTRKCALELAQILGDSVHELSPGELSEPEYTVLDTCDARVIWAFPTYSWGVPPVVENYIAKVKFGEGVCAARHYMLTTCGDDMGATDKQWRRLMKRRGLAAVSAFAVIMPNTYVLMKGFDVDPADVAKRKIATHTERIRAIADAIENGGDDMLVPGAWPRVKSRIIYPWFVRFAMSPKPFHSTAGCVGCGRCASLCPMANIDMTDGKPTWRKQCALCLRCYHVCPQKAVAYGKSTNAKGQYHCL